MGQEQSQLETLQPLESSEPQTTEEQVEVSSNAVAQSIAPEDFVEVVENKVAESAELATPPTEIQTEADPQPTAASSSSAEELKGLIVEQLKTIFDPEIPVNIYEMGLIYDVDVEPDGATKIRMTLTTPMCPAAEELPPEVEGKAREVEGVTSVQLDLVWEPPWTPDMMSEAARLELGMI